MSYEEPLRVMERVNVVGPNHNIKEVYKWEPSTSTATVPAKTHPQRFAVGEIPLAPLILNNPNKFKAISDGVVWVVALMFDATTASNRAHRILANGLLLVHIKYLFPSEEEGTVYRIYSRNNAGMYHSTCTQQFL